MIHHLWFVLSRSRFLFRSLIAALRTLFRLPITIVIEANAT